MRHLTRATPSHLPARAFIVAMLLIGLSLGCEQVDRLEAIRLQQETGDYLGSIEPLRALLSEAPEDAEVNYRYGLALVATQQQHLAIWSLRTAMKDPDWEILAGSQLAFVALAAGDFNEVVEITSEILERHPEHTSSLLMRANAYAHWKTAPALALADAARVLELDPDALEAYEPQILALLSLEKLDEAREALAEAGRRLVERDDRTQQQAVLAWHCSTTAAFEQVSGDLEQARTTWGACLEAHPTSLEVVSNAMVFYDSLGEPQRTRELLHAAVAEAPKNRVLRVMLAQWLGSRGEAAEAEAVLREATESDDPRRAAAAWVDLAKNRQALGEHGAAADALEQAVELSREADVLTPQMLFELADARVLAGRFPEALELAEDLSVPAHRALIRGRVAQENRNPAKALAEFDEALRLWPDNPWARYHAAIVAEELGDFERALEEYRFAIRISPGATDARKRGADLLLASGNPSSAIQMLVVATADAPLEIEGQLLFLQLSGLAGDMKAIAHELEQIEQVRPGWSGRALAEAAKGLARRAGAKVARDMLHTAPGAEFSQPRFAAALRALVRLSHEAGEPAESRPVLQQALDTHPDFAEFQQIRGLDLELSAAPAAEVRAAYEQALELDPNSRHALEGLGRLTLAEDATRALALFDRAAESDPTAPEPKLMAVRALLASGGDPVELGERLRRLLLYHPYETAAAVESVKLDLARGVASAETLERARRATRFGGGVEALELLARVHEERGDAESAARATEQARGLREAQDSDG
jgi:tetratricopeptide (TPR) repeat protein